MILHTLVSSLFPYTTLFRSKDGFFQSEFIVGNYFSAEVSVFTSPSYNFADANLFNAFYRNTISIAFGESSRRAEYTAYLPIRFLHTLSTADIIVIANKKHIIESYSTNFLTGKTSFKLIQIDEATSDLFTTKSVNIVDGSSSKSSCFISADTGEATHIFTDNSTTHNVVDRKSTRLNSSHGYISYAVFCLKKQTKKLVINTNIQQYVKKTIL